jgi:hypothetical protein
MKVDEDHQEKSIDRPENKPCSPVTFRRVGNEEEHI